MSKIEFDDTLQGALGDCWVLATMSALAEKPERIWKLFGTKKMNSAGIYAINMYDLGVPVSVIVDDYIPVSYNDNKYVKVTGDEKEIWSILIEKAFAKMNGNYASIVGGWPTHAGYHLSGLSGEDVWTDKSADEIWAKAVDWDAKGHIMMAGTSASANGIVGGHAYTVVSVHTMPNGDRVMKIRNPWGHTEWTGAYKDSDPFWASNPNTASAVGFVNGNDGTFFMKVEDFKTHFQALMANPDTSNWHHSYWMKIGDADSFGTTGNMWQCGSTCKHNKFTITSPIAQTIHVAAHVHMKRQYVEAPCTDSFNW